MRGISWPGWMMAKESKKGSKDQSAVSRLVYDIGLLIMEPSYERYLADQEYVRGKKLNGRDIPTESNLKRYLPILPLIDLPIGSVKNPASAYCEELGRLEWIDDVLSAINRTLDFDLSIRDFMKTLKRKFDGESILRAKLNSKQILPPHVIDQCKAVQSMIREFPIEDETGFDIDAGMSDVNIFSILLDAQRLFQNEGIVHSGTYCWLKEYQKDRGGGRPRIYTKPLFTVLMVEFCEEFCPNPRAFTIHDFSSDTYDASDANNKRKPKFDSTFARILIEFSKISDQMKLLDDESDDLLHHRDFLHHRKEQKKFPNITKLIQSSTNARDFQKIISLLDSIK